MGTQNRKLNKIHWSKQSELLTQNSSQQTCTRLLVGACSLAMIPSIRDMNVGRIHFHQVLFAHSGLWT